MVHFRVLNTTAALVGGEKYSLGKLGTNKPLHFSNRHATQQASICYPLVVFL
jgi:hypothetical protein